MAKVDKKVNFLDLIPDKNCRWEKTGDGRTYLLVPRFKNRLMKKIAVKLKRSEFVKIHLDNIGTQVWDLVNGSNTVEQIGKIMEKEKGEPIDQLYQRLTEFLSILSRNRFIILKDMEGQTFK